MSIIDRMAEKYIREAIENGELENLPGDGKPLKLDDDSMVPRELRVGYRLLKNSGHLPPELSLRGEIRDVAALILKAAEAEQERLDSRLRVLQMRLDMSREQRGSALLQSPYLETILRLK